MNQELRIMNENTANFLFVVGTLKVRLDKFLVEQLPGVSRSQIQKTIEAGGVSVNGETAFESKFVARMGDSVEYRKIKDPGLKTRGNQAVLKIKVLYDDHGLLIIDKPAGLSVHPGAGVKEESLSDILLRQFPEIEGVGETHRPGIVHRLDKDTSGVMLVAKTVAMYEYLKDAFADRRVKKNYLALVFGVPDKAHGFVDAPLGKSKTDFRKYTTKDMVESKPSLTEYRVLEVLTLKSQVSSLGSGAVDKTALISVDLHTGRTHQIRVHMASLGHPLMGDALYGGKRAVLEGLHRQFLHARKIEVQLPEGTWIEAESELPNDLREMLVNLNSKIVSNI